MRIDKLEVKNFKKFAEQEFDFNRQFTLLVGDNGSGKTSVLDALAVGLGVWLLDPPDSSLEGSRRRLQASEKRIEWVRSGDRSQFLEAAEEVSVRARGEIAFAPAITWEQRILPGKRRGNNSRAKEAMEVISEVYKLSRTKPVSLPVIGYYGAGRAWLAHHDRSDKPRESNGLTNRWAAFYDCLNERIRIADLRKWFQDEAIASANRKGRFRPGFEVVKHAVLKCVPAADNLWFDVDRKDIVLSINDNPQPFGNLSAGQRMMLALVADIAVKAVTQNNFLVPADELIEADELPQVLTATPGVVLIDELDVHLHPSWQRQVASDLKATFPQIQFVCTSHSPQVIGELQPDEIRLLDEPHVGEAPAHSLGLDSNAILEEVMNAESRDSLSRSVIDAVDDALETGDLVTARSRLDQLRRLQQGPTRDTARLEATINNLEALADAGD